MNTERLTVAVECRASESGPMLRGVILAEGRAASGGRRELFAPGAATWPGDGIAIRGEHRGPELARAVPVREDGGEIRIETRATPEIMQAVEQDGKRFMSVEFYPLQERTTAGGVREIRRALVDAAALVRAPEYDTTAAEVRERRSRRPWWSR